MAASLLLALGLVLLDAQATSAAAGFLTAPLSQEGRAGGRIQLHCEAVGIPVPEIQWWFEGNQPGDPSSQLWDGARQDRVHIHATYGQHAASAMSIEGLRAEDAGTYECRASNDPDRNHLTRAPRVRWIHAQASVVVLEPGTVVTTMDSVGSRVHMACVLNHSDVAVTGHQWLREGKVLKEDQLPDLRTEYQVDRANGTGRYSCVFLPSTLGEAELLVSGPPVVKAVKKSEHASEKETVTLVCKSDSHPPIDTWVWYKVVDSEVQVITNGSNNKFFVSSSETQTQLRIQDLDMASDPGTYACNGTNTEGTGHATITLRVRSHLAALWPFLGIVAEVLVLVTIIFIYEKRRKPDEPLDDDAGSAPLKGSTPLVNDKDKNVRQRNAT
ncbi:basigin isoform X1 [Cavia porcellus]|uniref:Basigin n=1 Tax=Cavia porcellus TaxID=10141 RepID=H0W577_CAVPO|nr:basigin isoform X3 [Cavia porcellus]